MRISSFSNLEDPDNSDSEHLPLSDEEIDKMITEIHDIIRSACLGQLSSVPLAFLVGAIQGSTLASIAATIANPATIAIFGMAGIAGHLVKKIFKQLNEWEAERREELASETIINNIWNSIEKDLNKNKNVVSLANYRNRSKK